MKDYLVRSLTEDGTIRALACTTTELVQEGVRRHNARPTAAAALGRGLTGAVLMGALLKTGQRVALRFEGNGPLRKLIVEAESNGEVRGYVAEPGVDIRRADGGVDVAGAVGNAGLLTVVKDLRLREPYTSTVMLASSEIGADLAYYLTESEQIPSAVGLGVFPGPEGAPAAAGGFLVQALPGADSAQLDVLMERIGKLPPLGRFFLEGGAPELLLGQIFGDIPYRTLEKREAAFVCSCSRERISRVLVSLGQEALDEMLQDSQGPEVTCEFCRSAYRFDLDEVAALKKEALS